MKQLLLFFTLLFIAVYLGIHLSGQAGYVLFVYKNWSIEVSLWFLILAILSLVFFYYIFSRTFSGVLNVFEDFWQWIRRRKAEKARGLMQKSFFAFIFEDSWALKELLPQLSKSKLLTEKEFSVFELEVYHACLLKDFSFWEKMPRRLRNNVGLLTDYCTCLIKAERHDEAESLLKYALKKQWDSRLIRSYGQVKSPKPLKQLAWAKTWLESHGNDPDLLCCLGRLNMRYSAWGLARDYLQASLNAGGGVEVQYELAKVLEALGEQAAALECYRKLAKELLD